MSSRYVLIFIFLLTSVVAVTLTAFRQATNEQAVQNEDIFNKRAILLAIQDYLPDGKKVDDLTDEDVLGIFDKMESFTINTKGEKVEGVSAAALNLEKEYKKAVEDRRLPVYIYNKDGQKYYILSVRGKGLWDAIWGYIALESDLNTIAGAAFDHKGETPGMGAEIKDNPRFRESFKGKQLYEGDKYVSIFVRKGGAVDKKHEVDGISAATMTGNGMNAMLYNGIDLYLPFFESIKNNN